MYATRSVSADSWSLAGELPVTQRAPKPGPSFGREVRFAPGEVADRSQRVMSAVGEKSLAEPGTGA